MATSPTDVFPFPASPDNGGASPAVLVRAVRQQDLASLTELLARGFHPPGSVMDWLYPLLRMGIYEDLRSRLNTHSPHQVFLVAVPHLSAGLERLRSTSAPIVGAVEVAQRSASLWHPRQTRHLYLSNLAVQAEYRRQGVARQLLAACDRVAIEWRIPDLYLHVLEDNHAAKELYFGGGYRLERMDTRIGSLLFGQPRQMYLHKHLTGRRDS